MQGENEKEKEDETMYKLLANPYYHKKKKMSTINTIDDELFLLLNRKFPHLKILQEDYIENIKKIERLFIETSNRYIIQEVIEQIIHSILNEQVLL